MTQAQMPTWIAPMAATLTPERFAGPDWIFERKLDGIRMLAFKQGREVRLLSRNRLPLNASYPTVAMAVDETRTVNLVFASSSAMDDVSMVITLPAGVELRGHEGEQQVSWTTRLAAGNNILPLTLMASAPTTGQLVARLKRGEREKVFRVYVAVNAV